MQNLKIGQLARLASVNIQTVRYYDRIGLLKPKVRQETGYRIYDEASLQRLHFIKRAQELGFKLAEVRDLLSIRVSSTSEGREKVRAKVESKLRAIRQKIRALEELETTLSELVQDCERGSQSGPCPILEKLERKR